MKGGLDCLKLCSKQTGAQGIMEVFTEVFTVMDAWDFVEIMTAKMDYMFESIKADGDLLGLVDLLLEKKQAGLHFIDILGAYLADKKLSVLEDPESEVLFKLFMCDVDRKSALLFNQFRDSTTIDELVPVCAVKYSYWNCMSFDSRNNLWLSMPIIDQKPTKPTSIFYGALNVPYNSRIVPINVSTFSHLVLNQVLCFSYTHSKTTQHMLV